MADAQHIDAVARLVCPHPAGHATGAEEPWCREKSAAVLDSTDPAVHAAMLDALVRAGVLRESWMHRNASGGGSIHETRDLAEAEQAEYLHRRSGRRMSEPPMPESEGIFRRLVTEWESRP